MSDPNQKANNQEGNTVPIPRRDLELNPPNRNAVPPTPAPPQQNDDPDGRRHAQRLANLEKARKAKERKRQERDREQNAADNAQRYEKPPEQPDPPRSRYERYYDDSSDEEPPKKRRRTGEKDQANMGGGPSSFMGDVVSSASRGVANIVGIGVTSLLAAVAFVSVRAAKEHMPNVFGTSNKQDEVDPKLVEAWTKSTHLTEHE